jgi:predicted acylesterase/phospholipase RssA
VSSGALNAVYLAHALHAGTVPSAGEVLSKLWIDAGFFHVFDLNLKSLFGLRGLSGEDKVLALMRREIRPVDAAGPTDLRVVVTNAAGDTRRLDGHAATTFEHVLSFDNHAFNDAHRLESVFQAVAASAAFPIVFAPVKLTINHREVPAFDGGAVNNTPLRHAVEGRQDVDRIFVVTAFPRLQPQPPPMSGLGLASHLADVLVEERLFRDLRQADEENRMLARLDALPLERHQLHAVLEALGWQKRRKVTIVEVRPDPPLEGDAFSGFFCRRMRRDYVEAGRAAGQRVVEELSAARA